MKLNILFDNADYRAFAKPSGLLTIADRYHPEIPNLVTMARQKSGSLFVVHRLDKDTSGIVCFAKNEAAHRHLSQCFENREITKYYQAIVTGTPYQMKDSIRKPITHDPVNKGRMLVALKGKEARTDYEVLESWKHFSLLNIQLFTGRTHQIRVHLKDIGHPVVADPFYGDGQPFLLSSVKRKYRLSDDELEERPVLGRLALHATALTFKDEKGEVIHIQSPLPKDMQAMVKLLAKWDRPD
ncbi:MAG TPA: RNA pseudouridine synthase [Edaphocola sp.]|nr:RNA pseudouridine synthase [Edaphocola sp.]